MSRVAVTVLTNGKRRKSLERCLNTFLDNCRYRPLDIYILDNGSTDDTREYLDSLKDGHGLWWDVQSLGEDVGCAAGTNRVSEMAVGHEYVLHLESDFFHIPEDVSGFNKMWLSDVVSFMDEGRCDYLYLRKMVDEEEMAMHWWAQWMEKSKTFGKYMYCPEFWWSNNPHLRRDSKLRVDKILPLDESIDGDKGTPGWSKPELEAGTPGLSWICKLGMFIHERESVGDMSCPKMDGDCKYGFSVRNKVFCESCDIAKGLCDMYQHEGRYSCVTR